MWVEDQDYNIVRLNGTYAPRPKKRLLLSHGQLALEPDSGLLAANLHLQRRRRLQLRGSKDKMAFKAQSRIWGYQI
jgi:hypothetical protein